jgi:hypothetical protein
MYIECAVVVEEVAEGVAPLEFEVFNASGTNITLFGSRSSNFSLPTTRSWQHTKLVPTAMFFLQ